MTETVSPLMARRIRRILLVCNNYDKFALEEDGRIEPRISAEYAELNLSGPPVIERVESTKEALALMEGGQEYDLVITMYNVGEIDVFEFSRRVKEIAPDTSIVLLTAFAKEIYKKMEDRDISHFDGIFCWYNSTDLIIAIIKLLEDSRNAPVDILENGVQCILLVEDSIRYYSTYLPELYRLILKQNSEAIRDALNESQQTLRKRARPKILMATNYDDAVALYEKYKSNMLGVISDIGFVLHRGDKPSQEKLDAGIDLCRMIRQEDPKMPILMQSSQESMRTVAKTLQAGFLIKRSKTLNHDLAEFIGREFGFGDFVVTNPLTGEEIDRASDLYGAERIINTISDDDLARLASKNYISRWLLARGLFDIGNRIKMSDFDNQDERRRTIVGYIRNYRMEQGLGVVARFETVRYNDAIRFARLGDGSLGGKARGLAFLNSILQRYDLYDKWEGVRVLVPRTLAITTEFFDRFILENGLQYVINADLSDEEILSEFVASTLPKDLTDALRIFIHHVRKPLAVRSSSKLEDSYYQPFAGVYSTYMVPCTENEDQQLRIISKAIKSVYASVYFASSRSYIIATGNMISEEKMAIVLQEICGSEDHGLWFPTLSGVARSLNFYPVGHETAEDGIVRLAFGLGKAVVDGEQTLRFSPAYPGHVIQTSTPELTMQETQQYMYGLNLRPETFKTSVDDAVNLERLRISDCTDFRNLQKVVSTFDFENQRMVDSPFPRGPKFVTFAHILRYNTFPLTDIVKELLAIGQREMNCCVEIEFAANLDKPADVARTFHVLQIRPISSDSLDTEVDWSTIDVDGAFIRSGSALGTGWVKDTRDIVYIPKDRFDKMQTKAMADEIAAINTKMREEGRGYVLIGYGRWGTSVPSLGIPVKWSDISEVKTLVECVLPDFRIDPSQGTHFFQNLTSFNVGFVHVDPYARREDEFDTAILDALPAEYETKYWRLIHLDEPLKICIDGRDSRAFMKI
ncbi:MAG: phosphoenolpyruvate synthase [Bacteroidales bacterium]|nr:phosphoenolpyruvate synthase [Bacteroidales bacterium]